MHQFSYGQPAAEPPAPSRAQRTAGTVGVDLGVTRLVTLSTGIDASYPNPRHLAVAHRQLTRASTRSIAYAEGLQRRAKPAAGWPSCTIASRNEGGGTAPDPKELATRFETVAIEDLNVAGMTGPHAAPWTNLAGTSGRSPASTARSWTPGSVNSAGNWPIRRSGTDPGLGC